MMKKLLRAIPALLVLLLWTACSADDDFSSATDLRLTFSTDSVAIDTVFSRVPSSTRTFWVYNRSGKGIKCKSVRLAKGNQTGFRVNVDGIYLGSTTGYQTSDIEIRNNDSIRVFVEVTTPTVNSDAPVRISDDLVFTLASGAEQRMPLTAWSWDALLLHDIHVSSDTLISSSVPIVVYGNITVDSLATLKVMGTTVYFHENAGIHVYGRLVTDALNNRETVFRGDRLDRMFDYLPYDRVSGQWQGIRFHSSSFGNELRNTHIHSTYHGIVCDSAACDSTRSRLWLENCTIHNCQGYGLLAHHANITLRNCEISNTLNDCMAVHGGIVSIQHSTLAQFYPFDAMRGHTLYLSNRHHDATAGLRAAIVNSLITGYADDVLGGDRDTTALFDYRFENCLLRTPRVTDGDSVCYVNVIYEDAKDTIMAGKKNFACVDEDNLIYDFRLSSTSRAIDAALPITSLPADRYGVRRDEHPDIGAYELRR